MKIEVNYTGQFLHRQENHTEKGFCSHIRTVISAQYIQLRERSCAVPISKVESHISDRCSHSCRYSVNIALYKVLQKTVILVIIINYNSIETFKSRSREDQSSTLLWLVKKHFETKNKVLYAGKLQRVRFPHSPIHLGGLI